MKKIKTIDCILQAALMATCLGISLAKMDATFITGYFVVGGYQFLSMLAHEIYGFGTQKGSSRRTYHNIVYIIVACMALTPLIYVTGIVFLPMLFIAPIMALYYLRLCYRETFVYLNRPLSVLK